MLMPVSDLKFAQPARRNLLAPVLLAFLILGTVLALLPQPPRLRALAPRNHDQPRPVRRRHDPPPLPRHQRGMGPSPQGRPQRRPLPSGPAGGPDQPRQ